MNFIGSSTVEEELLESLVRTWMSFRNPKWESFSVPLSLSPQEGKGDRSLTLEAMIMATNWRGREELFQMHIALTALSVMSNRWVYMMLQKQSVTVFVIALCYVSKGERERDNFLPFTVYSPVWVSVQCEELHPHYLPITGSGFRSQEG